MLREDVATKAGRRVRWFVQDRQVSMIKQAGRQVCGLED